MNYDEDENKKFIFMVQRFMPMDPMPLNKIIKKQNQVIGYEIGNEFVSKEKAMIMAKEGKILQVGIGHTKDEEECLIKHPELVKIEDTKIEVKEEKK